MGSAAVRARTSVGHPRQGRVAVVRGANTLVCRVDTPVDAFRDLANSVAVSNIPADKPCWQMPASRKPRWISLGWTSETRRQECRRGKQECSRHLSFGLPRVGRYCFFGGSACFFCPPRKRGARGTGFALAIST